MTRVDFGISSFLFTGDLEEPAIDRLVAGHQTSSLLDVDVYAPSPCPLPPPRGERVG